MKKKRASNNSSTQKNIDKAQGSNMSINSNGSSVKTPYKNNIPTI